MPHRSARISLARARSASTSARLGIDGAVPARVTEMPATAHPKRAASTGSKPAGERGGEAAVEGVARAGRLHHRTGPEGGNERRAALGVEERAGLAERDQRRADALRRKKSPAFRASSTLSTGTPRQERRLGLVRGDVVAERVDRIVDRYRRAPD